MRNNNGGYLADTIRTSGKHTGDREAAIIGLPHDFGSARPRVFHGAEPVLDQIHPVDFLDTIVAGDMAQPHSGGAIVTHADGSQVSTSKPAQPGEELVMYAVASAQPIRRSKTGAASRAARCSHWNIRSEFRLSPKRATRASDHLAIFFFPVSGFCRPDSRLCRAVSNQLRGPNAGRAHPAPSAPAMQR